MPIAPEIKRKLERVFPGEQAEVLAEALADAHSEVAKEVDLNELKGIVRDLASAQERTENRLEQLASAQERTEQALQKLVEEHTETRRQLGGLAMTVGYTLENEAYRALPRLLAADFGLRVKDRLKRAYVTDREGQSLEINIFGEAQAEGRDVVILGESKSQMSANDVDRFIRRKLDRLKGLFTEVFPILITHMISAPEVEAYAREKGIALYYSYDF